MITPDKTAITLLFLLFSVTLAATASAQTTTQPLPEGERLYRTHCAGCHKPLASTTKPQRSASRIRSSIEHFPAMNHLKFLSAAEVEAIAESLQTVAFDN